jgi:hypothetical protein
MAHGSVAISADDAGRFLAEGYLVLAGAFDPTPLADEVDRALAEGDRGGPQVVFDAISFRYVPMMGEGTPVSLGLLDALAEPAAELLGGPVLPLRAKGTRYSASTAPHRDSTSELRSVGYLCYLEPLVSATGALRIAPGSHLDPTGSLEAIPLVAVETEPGDIIVMDEHVVHASDGGADRRQWRVDFFAAPVDDRGLELARAYVAATFPPDWDGGYDAVAFPSFGRHWQRLDRPWHEGLEEVGAYAAAAAQESRYPPRGVR